MTKPKWITGEEAYKLLGIGKERLYQFSRMDKVRLQEGLKPKYNLVFRVEKQDGRKGKRWYLESSVLALRKMLLQTDYTNGLKRLLRRQKALKQLK